MTNDVGETPLVSLDAGLKSIPRAPRWVWILPRLAAILAPVVIGSLLWLLHHNDLEDQRRTLISDVLWLEQNLRFQLDRNLEQLRLLGNDAFENKVADDIYAARARALIQNANGLIQTVRLDGPGKVRSMVPPSLPEPQGRLTAQAEIDEVLRLARQIDKALYSRPYRVAANEAHFAVVIPHYRDGRLSGMVVGVYSMQTLLHQMVPWWFVEKYRVAVADHNGVTLASKSLIQASESALSYPLEFDPPGHGLKLNVTAYHARTRLLPALLMVTIVLLAAAILVSLWAVKRHVQRRVAAENALREEYAFRKAMGDSLLTGLRARDLDGRIIYVNPAFCQMVGWSAEELVGRAAPMPYWAPEDTARTLAAHDQIISGTRKNEPVELRFQRKNGERFDALIYEAPLIDADGKHCGWMGSMLDITERKRAEERYRQQQERLQFTARLVTMGEMASTLAHELNQPLSAISSYATGSLNLINGADAQGDGVGEALGKIVAQAQRAGQVIRRVHEFVRRREPNLEAVALNSIVEDAIGLIETAARQAGVRIQVDVAPDLPAVQADKVMIEQVLLNLMRNGMDAVASMPLEQRVLIVATAPRDRGACVSVSDRGVGIAPELATQLYQPFFSTKHDGMGMGLNICRSIAEIHHARLWFEPRPEGGTVFHLWLPQAA